MIFITTNPPLGGTMNFLVVTSLCSCMMFGSLFAGTSASNTPSEQNKQNDMQKETLLLKIIIAFVEIISVITLTIIFLPLFSKNIQRPSDSMSPQQTKKTEDFSNQGIKGFVYYTDPDQKNVKHIWSNIIVFIYLPDGSQKAMVSTMTDGSFSINLPAGSYNVCIKNKQFCQQVEVAPGRFTENIEIIYTANGN